MIDAEHNKQIVQEFVRLAFDEGRPAEAAARHVGSPYIQHNPQAPDGPEAFIGFLTQLPDLRLDVKRVIAEGDLVVVHSLMTMSDADRGTAVVDIFRLEDGKIVEHWDVLQEVPGTTANANTMF
ncbi:nuclear transport factor 2 family protein [Nonomuraea dietziae]|uniref:nuclear transport factor 2 family protein n=1 Tax=Nonomuraea dietziae TaxID=65515 RepID=UPI00343937EE